MGKPKVVSVSRPEDGAGRFQQRGFLPFWHNTFESAEDGSIRFLKAGRASAPHNPFRESRRARAQPRNTGSFLGWVSARLRKRPPD